MSIPRNKARLSPEVLEALALSGADTSEMTPGPQATGKTEKGTTDLETETETETEAESTETETETESTETETETESAAAAAANAPTNDLMAHLRTQNAELLRSTATLEADLRVRTNERDVAQATCTLLQQPIDTIVKRLAVGLNASLAGYDKQSPEGKVEFFNELNAQFLTKFKVGATSTPHADASDEPVAAQPSDGRAAALRQAINNQSNR